MHVKNTNDEKTTKIKMEEEMAKEEKERKKTVNVFCPKCGRSLLTNEETIDGEPCVHIKTEEGDDIFISSIWNNFKKKGHRIPKGTIIKAYCPHCNEPFPVSNLTCEQCGEKLISLKSKTNN